MSTVDRRWCRDTRLGRILLAGLTASLIGCASLRDFEDMDADDSGAISRDEASSSQDLMDLFASADDNGDGVLDEEEYRLARTAITGVRRSEPRLLMKTEKGGL